MTPTELIRRLYDLGHFHNPKYPTGITLADLPKLKLHSWQTRLAIQSYVDYMTGIAYADPSDPAAMQLIAEPRCGFPDFPYPEGIMPAQLEASFPTTCRGKLTFGRNFAKLPGLTESDTDDVFHAMTNTWSIAIDVEIVITSFANALIYATLKNLGGGTLAWSFLTDGSCTRRLEQAYDSSRTWSKDLGYPVPTHEVGHALGFSHNNDQDSLMFPSIHARSIARKGWPNATDLAVAKKQGYQLSGKPQPPLADLHRPRPWEPEPPPDPPPTGKLRFGGEFEAFIGEQSYGKFILVPKPEA